MGSSSSGPATRFAATTCRSYTVKVDADSHVWREPATEERTNGALSRYGIRRCMTAFGRPRVTVKWPVWGRQLTGDFGVDSCHADSQLPTAAKRQKRTFRSYGRDPQFGTREGAKRLGSLVFLFTLLPHPPAA